MAEKKFDKTEAKIEGVLEIRNALMTALMSESKYGGHGDIVIAAGISYFIGDVLKLSGENKNIVKAVLSSAIKDT